MYFLKGRETDTGEIAIQDRMKDKAYLRTIKGVEVVDSCLERIYEKIEQLQGTMVIIADHGNCEEMLDDDDNVLTSHTTNLVPVIITRKNLTLRDGKLGDVAPTILDLLNLKKPPEMTGESIIKK